MNLNFDNTSKNEVKEETKEFPDFLFGDIEMIFFKKLILTKDEHEQWKENFLLEIEKEGKCITYNNSEDEYRVLELPFYTQGTNERQFKKVFEKLFII